MNPVSVHFSPTPREYTGRELRSHFALHAFGIQGDAAVAFVGPCHVDLEHMVDLEDVLAGDSISSPLMLHAIVEHFGLELREGVLRQRLLGRLAADLLQEKGVAAVRVRCWSRSGCNAGAIAFSSWAGNELVNPKSAAAGPGT